MVLGRTVLCIPIFLIMSLFAKNILMIAAYEYILVDNSTYHVSDTIPESIVLYPNEYMTRGQYKLSPNGKYRAGFSESGNLVIEYMHFDPNNPLLIWSTGLVPNSGSECYMQTDGNLVIRDDNTSRAWSSHTHGYPASKLVVDDAGQMAIISGSNRLWLAGLAQPRDRNF
jgi:hypothetical protein